MLCDTPPRVWFSLDFSPLSAESKAAGTTAAMYTLGDATPIQGLTALSAAAAVHRKCRPRIATDGRRSHGGRHCIHNTIMPSGRRTLHHPTVICAHREKTVTFFGPAASHSPRRRFFHDREACNNDNNNNITSAAARRLYNRYVGVIINDGRTDFRRSRIERQLTNDRR